MKTIKDLRKIFLQTFDDFLKIDDSKSEHDTTKAFLIATYEYCRNRKINNITNIEPAEDVKLSMNLFNVIRKLGHDGMLWRLSLKLHEKDLFDFLKYRSAVQFLIDEFGNLIINQTENDKFIKLCYAGFEPKEYFLDYVFDENFPDPYPKDPVPEHNGVPESHIWWEKIKNIYD